MLSQFRESFHTRQGTGFHTNLTATTAPQRAAAAAGLEPRRWRSRSPEIGHVRQGISHVRRGIGQVRQRAL